jgi:hypothetical protein
MMTLPVLSLGLSLLRIADGVVKGHAYVIESAEMGK